MSSPGSSESDAGVAPADRRPHRRWPRWRIFLAYLILFAVAIGSIWVIDDHVLKATPPPGPPASQETFPPNR